MPKKNLIKFDKNRFLNWEKEYWWKSADEAIYEIFRKPNDGDILRSKLLILSRCYRTNIEMKADIEDIADNLLSSDEFRDVSQQLSNDPLNNAIFSENVEIYSIHYKLMKAIKRTTKTNESVFVSNFSFKIS